MFYFEQLIARTLKSKKVKKALQDFEDTVNSFAQSERLEDIKSREFSDKAGYSQSALFHYFKKFDDIFSYIFLVRARKANLSMGEMINKHPADAPLSVLLEMVVKRSIKELNVPPRKALLFVLKKVLKNTENLQLINISADAVIPVWMAAANRDKTNTIFKFNEQELRLRVRALQAVIRSPFFEDSAMAGTSEHSEIAYSLAMNIFSAPVVVD
jgi:AcrR family transcriptional regulator